MATPNITFVSGAILTAQQQNNFPFGICGLQTIQAVFTTAATHTNMQATGMTLTITEISGRRYKITAIVNPFPSGGQQGVNMAILRNSVIIKQGNFSTNVMDSGTAFPTMVTFVYTSVGSGSATFAVSMQAASANTAVSDYGDASFPRQFIIEDIGSS